MFKYSISQKLRWYTKFMYCYGVIWVNFTHILQGYFTGTGAIVQLPQWQWSISEEYEGESVTYIKKWL